MKLGDMWFVKLGDLCGSINYMGCFREKSGGVGS